eukprot:GHUV01029061.1.p1 GENE.GHUV01029061.1~~GHUV01029061.1.p1  ORF type:complete len:150 (+),score=31.82 GHUV01029061.1:259-708(+)
MDTWLTVQIPGCNTSLHHTQLDEADLREVLEITRHMPTDLIHEPPGWFIVLPALGLAAGDDVRVASSLVDAWEEGNIVAGPVATSKDLVQQHYAQHIGNRLQDTLRYRLHADDAQRVECNTGCQWGLYAECADRLHKPSSRRRGYTSSQ